MMRLFRPGLALVVALLHAHPFSAQRVQEKLQVDLVRVDLVVTDKSGKPIGDLSPSEIRLEIDGRVQPIAGLEPPAPEAATPAEPKAPPAEEASADRGEPARSPEPAAPASAASSNAHALAILIDETTSEQFNRNAMYTQLSDFLDAGLPPGTVLALERFDGKLHVECPWTSDVDRIRTAAAAMEKRGILPRVGAPGRLAPLPGGGATANTTRLEALDLSQHLERSVSGLIEAIQTYPADAARRKTLVFVSDGAQFLTPTEIVAELIASSESSAERLPPPFKAGAIEQDEDHDQRLLLESVSHPRWFSQWTDATELAMRRGIEIVPARSAIFEAGSSVTAEYAGLGPAGQTGTSRKGVAPATSQVWTGVGMAQVAEVTGGEPILARRDFARELRKEVEQRSGAYVLTFRDPHAGDHLFHRIDIRSDRPGARLRYRRGYRILGADESLADRVVGALYRTPSENPLGARTESRVLSKSGKSLELGLLISYPMPPGGSAGAASNALVVVVCTRDDGRRSTPFRIRSAGRVETTEQGSLVLVPVRLRLDRSTTALSVGVRDESSGLTSLLFLRPEL